jgi:pimeloyl-ACP methyl ester carboxylesterase
LSDHPLSGQRYIIYPSYVPGGSRQQVDTPDKHKMPKYEDLTLESHDKLKIKAFLIMQDGAEEAKKRPTVLFLHANAGNMVGVAYTIDSSTSTDALPPGSPLTFRARILREAEMQRIHAFVSRVSCLSAHISDFQPTHCILYSYGLSEGSPSEAGIRSDTQMALDYIKSHPVLENTKVFLYGQSIGGAVAVDLASNNADRVDGIVLENTFLSLVSLSEAV